MTEQELIEKARELYAYPSSDDLEIDDGAKISRAESGAWVQAWVFVPISDEEEES